MADEAVARAETPVIPVAGPIGAGKTSICLALVKELRDRKYRVAFIRERLPAVFTLYLKDRKKYALWFQMAMIAIRQEQMVDALALLASGECDFIVMERSIFEDILFFEANVAAGAIAPGFRTTYADQRQWTCDVAWGRVWFVYVDVDFETTEKRMCSRGRPGEVGAYTTTIEDRLYFRSIYNAYPRWVKNMRRDGFVIYEFNNDGHQDNLVRSADELDAATMLTESGNTTPEPEVEIVGIKCTGN